MEMNHTGEGDLLGQGLCLLLVTRHPSHCHVCHIHPLQNRGPGLLCFSLASSRQSSILAIPGSGEDRKGQTKLERPEKRGSNLAGWLHP